MPKFSRSSKKHLSECHPDLQKIMEELVKHFDIKVIEGHRSNDEQQKLFEAGKSKLPAGKSKHNQTPSLAVDVVPYPIDWSDRERFVMMAGMAKGIASQMGIKIRWGGDWDQDNRSDDERFFDGPHFELV